VTEMSGLTTDTAPAGSKYLLELDSADHTMASTGTEKKVTIAAAGKVITGWADLVRDYGADNTGTTSVSTALASACSAATAAQPATFGLRVPPGSYRVTAHQDLPYNLVMRGAGAAGGDVTNQYVGSVFQVPLTYTDSYVFGFRDTPHVSGYTGTNGAQVSDVFIDGSSVGSTHQAGAVDGMYVYGPTMVTLQNIRIARMSGWGINASGQDASMSENFPFGQSYTNVEVNSCGVVGGGGLNLVGCEDSVFLGVYSIGNGTGPGFLINACDNTKFIGCNAEWNNTHGFQVTGDWQYFTGGCTFTGCSTDANQQYGYYQDATWTTGGGAGTGPGIIHLTGCHFRRDGQGQASIGTGVYAGIGVGATTLPLIVTGFSTMPSIGDTGGGSMAPTYGIYFTNATYSVPIVFSGGLAWGYTTGIYHGATGGSAGSGFPSGVTSSAIALAHSNNYAPTYGS
jgi:hypothetical protein